MQITSLHYRTELLFTAFDGQVEDHGGYQVITTPSNPTFWWGNYILFGRPPKAGDLERWTEIFARHIGPATKVGHMTFGIDGKDGDAGHVEPFLAAGFELEQSVVLNTGEVHPPPKYNQDVLIEPLTTAEAWEQVGENQLLYHPPYLQEAEYRVFKQRQMQRYQKMASAGQGDWFGAFLDGKLVADLGIFYQGDIARYQSVGTHPDYRRQGICGTLVYHAARYAFSHYGVKTLVMVADEHYHAARIYESVGFKAREKSVGLAWADGKKH